MNAMTLELPLDLALEAGSRPVPRPVGHGVVQRLFTDVLSAEPYAVGSRRNGPAVRAAVVGPAVYRRRRLIAAVVLGLLISSLSLLGGELIGRVTGTPGSTVVEAAGEPIVYVVQPGDTLWSIAERVSPDGRDIRHTVDRLSAVTGGSLLHPGQRIVLPYG